MKAEDIAMFLRSHPQFFDQHPELLETIHVPHPYGGRAIPPPQPQAVALRRKGQPVEGKLSQLVPFGKENEAINQKLQHTARAPFPAPHRPPPPPPPHRLPPS